MALIADLCPNCQRVTRCSVVERNTLAGGILMGVPLVLPVSSVSCTCGECGFEFRSQFWDHGKSVAPAEAGSLDLEALLARTNPSLREKLTLAKLRENPRLGEAFGLYEGLTHGSLRASLKEALFRWPGLGGAGQDRLLADVGDCAKALAFARSVAGHYTFGAAGCVAALLGCAGVWAGCLVAFGTDLASGGWAAVLVAGVVAGGLLSALFWGNRDRRWVRGVLLPEARRAGIRPEILLAVLEGGGSPRQVEDELSLLRQLAPALRAELAASGEPAGEPAFVFGAMP
jgi:hypothetical protein